MMKYRSLPQVPRDLPELAFGIDEVLARASGRDQPKRCSTILVQWLRATLEYMDAALFPSVSSQIPILVL